MINFSEDDLIHADSSGPIGFGAIMGGAEKSVQSDTTAIILEAAVYNQASVRRGSIRHGLRSEASTRLEKFLNPELVDVALMRAVELILELANGKIVDNTDIYPKPKLPENILVHFDEISRLGGVQIARDEVFTILKRLQLSPHNSNDKSFKIEVPFFRTDLEQEADVIEEILRLWGYDNIPEKLLESAPPKNIQSKLYDFEDSVRNVLVAAGLDEQITEPLTSEEHSLLLPIKLENSLSADKKMLRTTLKNGLLKAFDERLKYRQNNIRLFEIGQIYYEEEGVYKEQSTIGLLLSFERVDFFDAKGVIELLFERLGRRGNSSLYKIDAFVYQNRTVYYIEINLKDLFAEKKQSFYRVSTTPPQVMLHDFSFIVSFDTKVGEMIEAIYKTDPLVYNVLLGEDPRDLGDGKKSVFIKVSYYKENQTLSEKEVAVVREKIIETVKEL
jgi:phenylalanyl-tRNA synthetase beta chain